MFALHEFLNPENLANLSNNEPIEHNQQFVFGSYPTLEELQNLKKDGYSHVISLLHPAVTPLEPMLLKEEENCKKVGIELINIPMLPWVSSNKQALDSIKQIPIHPDGKYYIHCYLGKDRVNLAKRLIANDTNDVKSVLAEGEARSLNNITRFERGAIAKLSNDIYFIPYPTDEEYMSYVIGGGIQQVISPMDSTGHEQKPRVDDEKKLLSTYHIPFTAFAIHSATEKKAIG